MSGSPALVVGLLRDHAAAGGAAFTRIVRLAFDEVRARGRLEHELCLVEEEADGLPRGSAAAVVAAFRRLEAQRAIAVIGPAITDNGLIVRDLADAAGLPCINWTGGEQTRSEWMFHYQVGSLEEEPAFLALHLSAGGARRIALVSDDTIVGVRYHEFFLEAAVRFGLDIAHHTRLTDGTTSDLGPALDRARAAPVDALVYLGLWFGAHELATALAARAWRPRVVANSALMFGHVSPEWSRAWEGWRYVDAYSERNPVLRDVLHRLGPDAGVAAVTVAAAYDIGRLVAEGVAVAPAPTAAGVKQGLERVKLIPAALGGPGTTMSFGAWEHAALKGPFLVLREWRDGSSVEV